LYARRRANNNEDARVQVDALTFGINWYALTMSPTFVAWLVLLALAVAIAGFIWLYDRLRRGATPAQKRFFTSTCLLAAALLFWWGLMSDQDDRRQTLHEIILPGNPRAADGRAAKDAGRRVTEFDVVHPGETHSLNVVPEYPVGTMRHQRRKFPVDISFQLDDAHGNRLVDETQRLKKGSDRRLHWEVNSIPFVPRHAGKHRLTLELRTPGVPEVRVRVADPLYKQGRRVEGY
jgi:nitrogen fixation-related uncharacterized protein